MLVSGASMYTGAAAGVTLFQWLSPAIVAWLRVCGAALVFLAIARPGRAAWRGRRLALAGAFGLATALMNIVFYLAIDRLPLGTAVAIEFIGPIAVAAAGSRTRRDIVSVIAAIVGVVLIADVQLVSEPLGMVYAFLAAVFWAAYIVLGKRVAVQGNPTDSLAVGFLVATIVTSPALLIAAGSVKHPFPALTVVTLGLTMGVLSNVIPYRLDQVILRTAGRDYFAILLALLPLTASLTGFLVLHQTPKPAELIGILAIVIAVAVRRPVRES